MSEQEIKRQNKAEAVAELFSINIQFPPSLLCVCVYVCFMIITVSITHFWWIRGPCVATAFLPNGVNEPRRDRLKHRGSICPRCCASSSIFLFFLLFLSFFFFFLNIARCVNPLCSSYLGGKNKQKKGILSCLLIVTLLLICFCLSFFLECLFSAQSPRLLLPWRRLLVHAVCILPDSLS